jgi:hypothetical protein
MAASEQLEQRDQIVSIVAHTPEQAELLALFIEMLNNVSKDGGRKRAAGTKPSWKVDTHERQIFSHLYKWKKGEKIDPHSGQHPLVHMAWRALAIAWQESRSIADATGNSEDVPDSLRKQAYLDRDGYLAYKAQRAQNLAMRKTSGWDTDYVAHGGSRTVPQREGEGL